MIISSKPGARLSAAGFLCFFSVFEGVGGRTFSFHAAITGRQGGNEAMTSAKNTEHREMNLHE
jgi:hypothetical protein